MTDKICCIFNLAPLYNAPIYKLMDQELNCDFYLGDRISSSIELMNYNILKNFIKKLKYRKLMGNFYWQSGAVHLSFKPYKYYIITGEPHCLSSWIIIIANKLTGRKTYLWTHGWYGSEGFLKKQLKKIFFGLSNKVLLYGDYARNLMIKEGFDSSKLITIYNSLDYDEQILLRGKLKSTSIYKEYFHNEYPIILYIGRIQNRKKIELLIESLNELAKNQSYYNLVLIGKETDETNIQHLVSFFQLEKYVWFFGACYDEEVLSQLIYNADVCVSPGNLGLTAMHSLVYGTPVITHGNFPHQMPEFEAIEPGLTGDFFIEDSVKDLCDKISQWTSLTTSHRESVRQHCYDMIDVKYNPHNQIGILKEALFNTNL